MKIAFLYNVRHTYPDPNDSPGQLETDFDDQETIEAMIVHFEKAGYSVVPIEADERAYAKLYKYKKEVDLAFNYSEGIYGQDRYAQIPAILEMLQIPYTGSAPLTQALVLNKSKAKQVLLANNLPTLPFQVFKTGREKLADGLKFPVIVKPVAQGSSAGITNASVVRNESDLQKQAKKIIASFGQPVLVEPFLAGREFSIGLVGNPPRVLPIIEADHSMLPKNYLPMDSLEVKWILEEQAKPGETPHLICPAKIDHVLEEKLSTICRQTWDVLGIADYCRIDLRCDEQNQPYVLDINSPAGLIPPEISTTSYLPLAARVAGIDYPNLLKTIIQAAIERRKSING